MTMKTDPRALCIGNFDGAHRGHQALLSAARSVSPHVAVLTFHPHPRLVFQPDAAPFLITSPAQKNDLLRRYGATEIITWPFSLDLAAVPAELFIEHVIIKQSKADIVVVGEDFQFGKNREGNIALLQSYADEGKFKLNVVPTVADGVEKISSTAIRKALSHGDIKAANNELGWNYVIEAKVIEGDKRGRELGFPTANQTVDPHVMLPSYGIYASYAYVDGKRLPACTSIGIRPMFEVPSPIVETHILDWNGDLYGQVLRVEPVLKLRDEAKYESLGELIYQIAQDCNKAKQLLGSAA